jgi:hypothetical protein
MLNADSALTLHWVCIGPASLTPDACTNLCRLAFCRVDADWMQAALNPLLQGECRVDAGFHFHSVSQRISCIRSACCKKHCWILLAVNASYLNRQMICLSPHCCSPQTAMAPAPLPPAPLPPSQSRVQSPSQSQAQSQSPSPAQSQVQVQSPSRVQVQVQSPNQRVDNCFE